MEEDPRKGSPLKTEKPTASVIKQIKPIYPFFHQSKLLENPAMEKDKRKKEHNELVSKLDEIAKQPIELAFS